MAYILSPVRILIILHKLLSGFRDLSDGFALVALTGVIPDCAVELIVILIFESPTFTHHGLIKNVETICIEPTCTYYLTHHCASIVCLLIFACCWWV